LSDQNHIEAPVHIMIWHGRCSGQFGNANYSVGCKKEPLRTGDHV